MSGLPAALEPWAEVLALFPKDLALSLGPWLQRLALGMGPLRARTREGLAEPDGYDGLTRRGPYERLLASEWLLASELPEEFTRRAAMREQSFLRLAYEAPAGAKRSVALFDTGPSQLGTPRIAHLAVLLVLSQRAKAAGASFSWGFLQHREAPLSQTVTPVLVRRLLHARTAQEATSEHARAWRDALEPSAPDDVWLVGAERLSKLADALPASRVVVRDVLEPGARRLAVSIRRARAAEVPLQLDLPKPDDCVRLLRDPFSAAVAPTQVVSAEEHRHIFYSTKGKRLLTMLGDGGVAAYPVPNSPRSAMGRPKRFYPARGHRLIAAGWHARLITLTWQDGQGLFLQGVHSRGVRIEGSLQQFKQPKRNAFLGAIHIWLDRGSYRLLFLDGAGTLFSVWLEEPDQLTVVDREVSGFSMTPSGLVYARKQTEEEYRQQFPEAVDGLSPVPPAVVLLETDSRKPLILRLRRDGQVGFGPQMAWVREDEAPSCTLLSRGNPVKVSLVKGDRVVAGLSGTHWGEEGVLVLEEDWKTLTRISPKGREELCVWPAHLKQICAHPDARELAFLTAADEVVVWSVDHQAPVLRLVPGGDEPRILRGAAP